MNNNYYTTVLDILKNVETKNLNDVFVKYQNIEDLAKIRNLVYGILRNYYAIDYILKVIVKRKNETLENILKIGIFELWFSYKPDYAVINDLVNLTKEMTENNLTGNFVNAVLRNFQKQKEQLLAEVDKSYEIKYNLPVWLLNKLKRQNKENYLTVIKSLMLHPSFGLRVNNKKISFAEYQNKLKDANLEYTVYDNKLILNNPINTKNIPLFDSGYVSVQDIGAQYLPDIINKNKIQFKNVLDSCSAPGGKACQLLENYDCNLTAVDIDKDRLEKVKQNLIRLNLKANLIQGDAGKKNWWNNKEFDLIVADVPCSATGTIKRNPDIKIMRTEKDISNFVDLQRKIISNLWIMLKNNGHMLYITCSLLDEENKLNINWFSDNIAGFKIIDEIQILPTEHNDGLYYCLIKKI